MDVFIKVEECGEDFGSSVTSTVVSPLGSAQDDHMSDLDFGMTLFDEKKASFFDPLAPMAEPVSTFHHHVKNNPGYEPVVTNIRPAAVVVSDDGGGYNSQVVTSVTSPEMLGKSPPPFSPNGAHSSYPGITILYEQKGAESSTSPHRKYMPQKGYSPTKSMSDASFTAADSNSSSTTKSFVPCKVCGDKASGYHYGVTSCEGCKGFFRRSIQKKIEYRCLRDEKCLVIRLNRNRCQFCRFKKCLDVGMSRDSVRYGRVPKRSRERLEENCRVTQSEEVGGGGGGGGGTESREMALYDLTLTVAQAHHANCAYTELRTRGLVHKPAIFSLNELAGSEGGGAADSLEQQKVAMWQHFAGLLTPSIQRIVEFAKKIPGFFDLTQDDQLLLIKKGFFEIWLVHASRLAADGALTFCDGSTVTRHQVELMFDYEFVLALFNFVTSLNNMELNDTEVALFSAIVLLTSERPGIYDHKAIDQLQERVRQALRAHLAQQRPGGDASGALLARLPELRTLGARHAAHLEWFRAHWARLRLPPLFAEIFDIPKGEEEP